MELVQAIENIEDLFKKKVISKDEYDSIKKKILYSTYVESDNNPLKTEIEKILSLKENDFIDDREMIDLFKKITTQEIEPTETQPIIMNKNNNDGKVWHYIDNGRKQYGPFDSEQMVHLLNDKSISLNTKVWRAGIEGWVPFSKTELLHVVPTPPPVISNIAAWFIALSPVFLIPFPWFISILILCILCYWDYTILKKGNYDTDLEIWWFALVPVYLYKRSKMLSQDQSILITWIIILVGSIFLSI